MFKMTAIYKMPADVNAFADWYASHTELAKKVPLTKEIRVSDFVRQKFLFYEVTRIIVRIQISFTITQFIH